MKAHFRPTVPADAARISAFLQRAFDVGPDASFLEPTVMAWKYWDGRDDWQGPRGYVLERGDVIVAHAGVYPMTFGQGAIRGMHMMDWASDKASPGAGLALLQKLSGLFDFIYASGGSETTRKVLPAFGFVECAGQWRAARPAQADAPGALAPVSRMAPRGPLCPNLAWSLPVPVRSGAAWSAQEVDPAMLSDRFAAVLPSTARVSPRSPAFFGYLARCPVLRIRTFRMTESGLDRGHFAVGVLRGQARLAGVWLNEPDDRGWQAGYALALQAARGLDDANELICAGTRGASERAATSAGLRVVGSAPVYLLNKKGKLPLRDDFQFQLADNDGAFFDHGAAAYWT